MKIQQKDTFQPITIVLETREEAMRFIECVDIAQESGKLTKPQKMMMIEISNQFGGFSL